MKKLNSRGIEMSFTWIFAIIVGISVLILAFILISKIIGIGTMQSDAKVAKEVGILLNPLETGFENAKTSSFSIPAESRIINKCYTEGNFGRQVIAISQFGFGKWSNTDVDVSFLNKYIFSNKTTEGRKFYVFSKPFNFPFKVKFVREHLKSHEIAHIILNHQRETLGVETEANYFARKLTRINLPPFPIDLIGAIEVLARNKKMVEYYAKNDNSWGELYIADLRKLAEKIQPIHNSI